MIEAPEPARKAARKSAPVPGWPSAGLGPGGRCRITEAEWFHFLETDEPIHQWSSAFLLDEGPDGLVRIYLRDDGPERRHACVRLDPSASLRAREGVAHIEQLSCRAADLITAMQNQTAQSVEDLAAQEQAGRALTDAAESLYRELLAP